MRFCSPEAAQGRQQRVISVNFSETVAVPAFPSFTLAILLFFVGQTVSQRSALLRRYSIPEPVVGGFLCACLVGVAYGVMGLRVEFELGVRDMLLLYFFAAIGLQSDLRTLLNGGRPLLWLLGLAIASIVLQNLLGMSVAGLFGLDPRAGLMTGSISLTGGIGTTLAWGPEFVERLGIANAVELGMASNMVGLVAACTVGGPVASYLMRRYRLSGGGAALDVGVVDEEKSPPLDYTGVLRALLWLNVALLLGEVITPLFHEIGLQLPMFVGCLLAGVLLRNLLGNWLTGGKDNPQRWQGIRQGLALMSDICLGLFLTMALMGMQLWTLDGVMVFVLTVLVLQILLTVAFTIWVVFRCMGRDYEAAVVCAGFGGIALGSTATAMANMTAVCQRHGAAHRAFIVVPLVCGFFVDIVNALVIQLLV